MKQLLTFFCCVTVAMLAIQPANAQSSKRWGGNVNPSFENPSPAKIQANKDTQARAKMAQMVTQYGLSLTQSKQWLEINKERDQKIDAIDKSLSPTVRRQQAEAIVNIHDQKLRKVLTPQQFAKFEETRTKNNTVAAKQAKIISDYRKASIELRSMEPTARKEADKKLLQEYAHRLKQLMPKDGDPRDRLRIPARMNLDISPMMKYLNLSEAQLDDLAQLQETRRNKQLRLEQQKLSPEETKTILSQINRNYETRVKEILGPDKFAQRAAYQSKSQEREFKTFYGFTDADYEQYKKVQNRTAFDIQQVKNSTQTAAQKESKIGAIQANKVKSLRTVLPAAQFEKWNSAMLARKAAAKANAAKKNAQPQK